MGPSRLFSIFVRPQLNGNLISTTHPLGHVTQFFYDDTTKAQPTRAVGDPLNGAGQQTTTTAYDFSTGLVTSQTDPNGNTATTISRTSCSAQSILWEARHSHRTVRGLSG